MRKLVSIVVPIYNEERVLPELISRMSKTVSALIGRYDFEILFVDDGSSDGSVEVARSLLAQEERLRILELRRNYGQTAALQAGIDESHGEYVITMDGDLQHFPEEIPSFLAKLEEGYDVVCGWRHDRKENLLRRWPSQAANAMIRRLTGLTIRDVGTTYRAYRMVILKDIRLLGENHRFIPVFAYIAGARIGEIKIQNIVRPVGESSYGLTRSLNVFLDILFVYFYTKYFDRPIRIFGKISLLLFAVAMIIAGTLILGSIIMDRPIPGRSGWASMTFFLTAQAIQILLIGILSEVLARLFYSSKERMPYHIRNEWNRNSVSSPELARNSDNDTASS
ncbi:glycosyltransferase family 2 protein [Candidatus Poribacteria bacterium]|nr:glycosyltransferase family 2 protein [Candidatus Poribacteria bacterium]